MRTIRGLVSLVRSRIECGGCVGVSCALAALTAEAGEKVAAAGEPTAKAACATDDDGDDGY